MTRSVLSPIEPVAPSNTTRLRCDELLTVNYLLNTQQKETDGCRQQNAVT